MVQTSKINANGIEIGVIGTEPDNSYISLTDIAKYKNSEDPRMVITNWMSSYSTIDFLAVWEEIHNSDDFNRLEFQSVRNERGRLIMTPKQWIERMQAKGIISKAGKYGGTYAHSDIAFEFASWISPEFKLYIIKDYQRLKKDEAERKAIGWDEKRALSKLNYHIHTDAGLIRWTLYLAFLMALSQIFSSIQLRAIERNFAASASVVAFVAFSNEYRSVGFE